MPHGSAGQTDSLSPACLEGQQAPHAPCCESSATLNAKMLKACLRPELQGSPVPSASAGKTPEFLQVTHVEHKRLRIPSLPTLRAQGLPLPLA